MSLERQSTTALVRLARTGTEPEYRQTDLLMPLRRVDERKSLLNVAPGHCARALTIPAAGALRLRGCPKRSVA